MTVIAKILMLEKIFYLNFTNRVFEEFILFNEFSPCHNNVTEEEELKYWRQMSFFIC